MDTYRGKVLSEDQEGPDGAAIVNAAVLLRHFSSGIVNDRHIRIMIPAPTPVEAPSLPPVPVEEDAEPMSRTVSTSHAQPSRTASISPSEAESTIRHMTCDCPLDSVVCHNATALRQIFFTAVKDEQERVLRLFTLCCLEDDRLRSLFWAQEHGNSGRSALQLAAAKGMADSVETIAEVLAGDSDKIDAADEAGVTSFMMAAHAGCLEAVKILDSFGAQRSLRSVMGKRAADYAEESRKKEVADYFSTPKPSGKPLMDFRSKMQKLRLMSDKMLDKIERRAFEVWCDTAGGHLRREAELQGFSDEEAREELAREFKDKNLRRSGSKWEEELRNRENAIRRRLCKYILDRAAENPDLVFVRLITSAKMLMQHLDREEKAQRERAETVAKAKDRSKNLWKILTKDVNQGSLTLQAVKAGQIKRPRMRAEVPMVPPATKLIHNKVAELSRRDVDASTASDHAKKIVDSSWLAGDGSGRLQYVSACKERLTRPDPAVLQQLASSRLVLNAFPMIRPREGVHEELLEEAEAVLTALRHNCLLRTLHVRSPATKEAGGEALVEAITHSHCLRDLAIHLGALTPTAVTILKDFLLDRHCNLVRLDLTDTALGNTGARILSQGLEGSTSLSGLFLRRCSIGAPGCTALAASVRASSTLTELDLSWNACGAPGAAALFSAIESAATTLRSLDLSWNRVGLPGAEALGLTLSANSTLRNLDVSHCAIPEAGCAMLAQGLASNTTLACLQIDSNPLGGKGRELIARALQNRSIRVSMNTGSSKPEPQMLTASNQPLHDLKANATGHYDLDLQIASHRAIASFLVAQGGAKGVGSWRNEALDGAPFEFTPSFELPEHGRLVLDFLEPRREDGEVMDDSNFDRFARLMQKIPSAGARLVQLRKTSEDFIFSSAQAMTLLGSLSDGLEREIAVLLLSSRIQDEKSVPSIIGILSRPSRNNIIIRAGPAPFFDPRYPAGRYYLRLNRRGDREVLSRLFRLAKTKPDRSIVFLTVCEGPLPIAELMSKPIRTELGQAPQLPVLKGVSIPGKEVMKYRWADNVDRLEQWASEETLDGDLNLHRIAYLKFDACTDADNEIREAAAQADKRAQTTVCIRAPSEVIVTVENTLAERQEDPLSTQAKRRVMEWLECLLPDGWTQEYEENQRAAQREVA